MQNNLSVVAFFPNELCVCVCVLVARRFFPAKETGGKNHASMGKIERQSVIIGFFVHCSIAIIKFVFGFDEFGLAFVRSLLCG